MSVNPIASLHAKEAERRVIAALQNTRRTMETHELSDLTLVEEELTPSSNAGTQDLQTESTSQEHDTSDDSARDIETASESQQAGPSEAGTENSQSVPLSQAHHPSEVVTQTSQAAPAHQESGPSEDITQTTRPASAPEANVRHSRRQPAS